jgi:5-methylcytosine-specific restriction enzyme A
MKLKLRDDMKVDIQKLDSLFDEFVGFIKEIDGEIFQDFSSSRYLIEQENYKYSVYEKAREILEKSEYWNIEDVGTGKIQKIVSSAISTSVEFNTNTISNNLVYWRKKDDFSKRPTSRVLEMTLFDFYKSRINDSDAFQQFVDEKLSYQFIAYLFFIKDSQIFLPISQEKFDQIFELIGLPEFKTRNKVSWDNYSEYCDIIKQVRDFLRTKDKNATLLDAHSFLWIIGDQMKEAKKTEVSSKDKSLTKQHLEKHNIYEYSEVTILNLPQWSEILENNKLTNELDLSIFRTLYNFKDHKAYASQIGAALKIPYSTLNSEFGRYAKRIAKLYQIHFTPRNEIKNKYWDLFFDGWDDGIKFVWQLKPKLVTALENVGLINEKLYPEELVEETTQELYEGAKRTVVVNSYERNSNARRDCIRYRKAICAVCNFNFEKTYGEIGKGFIHVHHVVPISQIGESYKIDPVNDLIPVCPNCHSMLHRQDPPFSIDELKRLLNIYSS